jgi:hypothetical protein
MATGTSPQAVGDYEYLPPKKAPAAAPHAPAAASGDYEYLPPAPPPAATTATPEQAAAPGMVPAELKPNNRGFLTNLKADTIGTVKNLYHAATDPATPEEQANIQAERPMMPGQTAPTTEPATLKEKLHERLIEAPRRQMMAEPDRDSATTVLAQVPFVGPAIQGTYRKVMAGDYGGAAADMAVMEAGELAPHLPEMARTATGMVRDAADIGHSAITGAPVGPARAMPATRTPAVPMTRAQIVQELQADSVQRGVEESARHVQAALPPSKSAPYTPQDIAAAKPWMDQHTASTPGSGVERYRDTADASLDTIESHVRQMIAANPQDVITTNPRAAAQAALSGGRAAVDSSFVDAGMKDLDRFNLNNPNVSQADDIRWKINQENKAVRLRNHYDQATAMATDPAYAAREAAADSLRDGIYGKLEERGMPGVDDLRRTEGSIIRLRNAAEKAYYSGEKAPPGTSGGLSAKVIQMGARKVLPGMIADAIMPDPLTRNQLLDRAMSLKGTARPTLPMIPAAPTPAGLLTEGAKPPIVTPAPADTSGTPKTPETAPQAVHSGSRESRLGVRPPNAAGKIEEVGPNPRQAVIVQGRAPGQRLLTAAPGGPQAPPNAAGTIERVGPATPTGGTMTLTPENPPPRPGQRTLPPAEPMVTGGQGNTVPTERPPRGKTAQKPESAPNRPGTPATATPAKPMAGRLTIPGINGMTDAAGLEQIINNPRISKNMRDAAYDRQKVVMRGMTQDEITKLKFGNSPEPPEPAPPAPAPPAPRPALTEAQQLRQQARDIRTRQAGTYGEAFANDREATAIEQRANALEGKTPRGVKEVDSAGNTVSKPQTAAPMSRQTIEPVAKRYSPEIIEQAEAEMRGAAELGNSLDKPGRYMDLTYGEGEWEGNRGPDYNWRGVKATKPTIAQQFPWFDDDRMNLTSLNDAIDKGKGANYERIMEKIANRIKNEPREPGEEVAEQPEGVLPGMAKHVEAQKAGAAKVQGEQMTQELQRPLGDISQKAGDLENNSPLFRGSEAAPQRDMFAGKAAPTEPPERTIKLYRAQPKAGTGAGLPEWVKNDPDSQESLRATGKWWTADPTIAKEYAERFVGPDAEIVEKEIPIAEANAARIDNLPQGHPAKRFSLDPQNEYFIEGKSESARKGKPEKSK